jgi:hypothetical protein
MGRLSDTLMGGACVISSAIIGGYCLYKLGIGNRSWEYLIPLTIVPFGLYELGQWFFSRQDVQISDAHGNSNHLPGLSQEDFERSHREADRAIEINNRLIENHK